MFDSHPGIPPSAQQAIIIRCRCRCRCRCRKISFQETYPVGEKKRRLRINVLYCVLTNSAPSVRSTKNIYSQSTTVSVPSFELGPSTPTPSPPSELALPPEPKGGGTHSPACEGVAESQFGRLERKLCTLSTLW